ncbi:MAG: DUF899 domain-containing protein [Verrucomicrobia bacterium]|nr:DUF899 domain-containing protein [Verrucomicrobiota bacterium]
MNAPSSPPRIVARAEWLLARQSLLAREKEHQHHRDALAAERRQLPWVKVDRPYSFDGPDGRETLAELFGGRSQLVVYHFMFGPGWEEGCKSCSFCMDHADPMLPHLRARDVTLLAVSRAPYAELAAFQRRMGWKFKWVSSGDSGFNTDFHVSFTREEMEAGRVNYNFQTFPPGLLPVEELPGVSVFARNAAGDVFHTYSAYARGCEPLLGTYHVLDLMPKGRDEEGLAHSMAWVRYHDRYDETNAVDSTAPYQPPRGSLFRPGCADTHA